MNTGEYRTQDQHLTPRAVASKIVLDPEELDLMQRAGAQTGVVVDVLTDPKLAGNAFAEQATRIRFYDRGEEVTGSPATYRRLAESAVNMGGCVVELTAEPGPAGLSPFYTALTSLREALAKDRSQRA